MTWKLITGSVASLAILAGCSSLGIGSNKNISNSTPATGASTAASTPSGDNGKTCNSDLAEEAVGQKVSPALVEKYRGVTGAKTARALRPRDVITMEYDPQRLNLRVDEKDIVISVNCS